MTSSEQAAYLSLSRLRESSEAVPIGDGMQIGEKNFLSGKEETRRNPDGFQAFLTQPDETFPVKIRAGAYWYSFSITTLLLLSPTGEREPPTPKVGSL